MQDQTAIQLTAALGEFVMMFAPNGYSQHSEFSGALVGLTEYAPALVQSLNAHTDALKENASALRAHTEALYEFNARAR